MDFSADPDIELVRESVRRVCSGFDDNYRAERDSKTNFPGISILRWLTEDGSALRSRKNLVAAGEESLRRR